MPEPKDLIQSDNYKGFTHKDCEWFPCHDVAKLHQPVEFNCLFCYCPLVWLECPGPYTVIEDADGNKRKDCTSCVLPHDGFNRSWKMMNLTHWQKNPRPWEGARAKRPHPIRQLTIRRKQTVFNEYTTSITIEVEASQLKDDLYKLIDDISYRGIKHYELRIGDIFKTTIDFCTGITGPFEQRLENVIKLVETEPGLIKGVNMQGIDADIQSTERAINNLKKLRRLLKDKVL